MQALQTEPEWGFPDNAAFLFEPHRYKIGKGGRGGTKSWSFARAFLVQGWRDPIRFLCAREIQKSIKESVHQLLSDQVEKLGLGIVQFPMDRLDLGKNGTKFVFTGLSNLTRESIKSYEGTNICWVEEADSVTRRSWDILVPTIRTDFYVDGERREAEIWASFNPQLDTDETWVRFVENKREDCFVQDMSYDTNPWFPSVLEKERQEFLRQVENGSRRQEDYDNIWLGKCRPALPGSIYPDEIQAALKSNRLCPVPYDPKLKVHTIWDLGWADSMAIGFAQTAASSVRFIDYIEDSHRTYDSYYQEIKEKKYNLGIAWLPHDGKAKNPQTGVSPIETLQKLGLKTDDKGVPDIGVHAGIEAARQMFSRCYFDKENCTPLFNRLRRYVRVISPTTNEAGAPKRDENTHGADMFRHVAVVESKLTNEAGNFSRKIVYPKDSGIV